MYNEKEYLELKRKILKRLDQKEVISSNNIISLYDLIEILKAHVNEYKDLYKNLNNDVNLINLKSRIYNLLGANLLKVTSLKYDFYPICENDFMLNLPFLKISFDSFDDNKNSKEKNIIFSKINDNYKMHVIDNNSSNVDLLKFDEDAQRFYDYHKKIINDYIDLIEKFASEYPLIANLDINWFNKNKNILIDDGFIKCNIDFDNIQNSSVTLSNIKDLNTSFYRKNNVDRELYEYIEFYNEGLQKRTSIDLNKLDPSIRYIVKHYYGLDKPMILQK